MNNVINNQEYPLIDSIDGKRDVFISYKRENAPFVTRLYEELDRHDISAWVDLSKLHKEVGEEYQEKIRKAIDSAEYFLLIYTEHKGCSIENQTLSSITNWNMLLQRGRRFCSIHKTLLTLQHQE